MLNLLKGLITLAIFSSVTTMACASGGVYLAPYIGADAQFRFMSFRNEYGSKNFRNHYPQANIYAGLKFCDYLGLEGGFYSSTDFTRGSTFGENERNLGIVLPASGNAIGAARIQGWHINAVGFLPVSECYCLTALAYIGAAQSKVTLRYIITDIGGFPDDFTANFSQTKTIMRAGAGIQHMISDCIGVRWLAGWEDTSKFSAIRTTTDPNLLVKLKSSVVLSLGLFAIF
jgi:hypothetical protein